MITSPPPNPVMGLYCIVILALLFILSLVEMALNGVNLGSYAAAGLSGWILFSIFFYIKREEAK